MRRDKELGSVAVEFALVLPLLILILLGIMEFGRAFNTQITLTEAAREGVRTMAITGDPSAAQTAAESAAVSLDASRMIFSIVTRDPADSSAAPVTDSCIPAWQVSMSIEYATSTMTGFFGDINLTGKGVMRCGG